MQGHSQNIIDYEHGGLQKAVYTEKEVERVPCPLCGESRYREIYHERGVLGIVRCHSCDLIYVNPRLRNPEQVYWGDGIKYWQEARLIFDGKASHHRDPNYLADLKLLERFRPHGRLLDIGTNMGMFLRHTRGKKWTVVGVEPSPSLSELARKYFDLDVQTGFLHQLRFPSDHFDIVTMTDVFEHIGTPRDFLLEVKRILKPDGIVFIKVPNGLFNLVKLKVLRAIGRTRPFDIFDSYEHVVHYSSKTLKSLLVKSGFAILSMSIARPIQSPAWHRYVGHYYQYPTPWFLDWKRYLARVLCYWLSYAEYLLRGRKVGWMAPNIAVIARKCGDMSGE